MLTCRPWVLIPQFLSSNILQSDLSEKIAEKSSIIAAGGIGRIFATLPLYSNKKYFQTNYYNFSEGLTHKN